MDNKTGEKTLINSEKIIFVDEYHLYLLDFYIEELHKNIEFDGEYFHRMKDKDERRDLELNNLGIQVLRIAEKAYRKNHRRIVKKCVKWILSDDKKY